ncbi:MAG: hypothetical protein IKA95_03510 [Clostridia bacterium]|nr:hypothetical protein [Clostridia bacterium]
MNINDASGISFEEFAEKYKNEYDALTCEEAHCDRTKRILTLSDRMLDKLSRAIDELSQCEEHEKKRTKEVEYDAELKKPVMETYTETEVCTVRETLIDTSALKQLVSTLKDIKDIQESYAKSVSSEDEEHGVIVISDVEAEQ